VNQRTPVGEDLRADSERPDQSGVHNDCSGKGMLPAVGKDLETVSHRDATVADCTAPPRGEYASKADLRR
jgi:hypothetical protein